MDNLEICKSLAFRASVEKSVCMTRDHHPREAGFSCWMNLEGRVIINDPVLGQDYQLANHRQMEMVHGQGVGFFEEEGSQSVIVFHTHPGVDTVNPQEIEDEEFLLQPSLFDVNFLFNKAQENRTIAEVFDTRFWINPISVIGSPSSSKWTLFQIDPLLAISDPTSLFSKGVWEMFNRYRPWQAKQGTGPITEVFGPNRDNFGKATAIQVYFEGFVPRFISSSVKRYREFLNLLGVSWVLIDPSDFPSLPDFSYLIQNPEFEEDEEDW